MIRARGCVWKRCRFEDVGEAARNGDANLDSAKAFDSEYQYKDMKRS